MNLRIRIFLLFFILFITSCSKGNTQDSYTFIDKEGTELTDDLIDDNSQDSEDCNKEDISTGDIYEITIVNGSAFIVGGSILIRMNHDIYSFGQAKNVSLYRNDDKIEDYGNWLNFPSNERSFIIPDVYPSICYNIRVTKEGSSVSDSDDPVYISELFEIAD